jgi:hypothetical protein
MAHEEDYYSIQVSMRASGACGTTSAWPPDCSFAQKVLDYHLGSAMTCSHRRCPNAGAPESKGGGRLAQTVDRKPAWTQQVTWPVQCIARSRRCVESLLSHSFDSAATTIPSAPHTTTPSRNVFYGARGGSDWLYHRCHRFLKLLFGGIAFSMRRKARKGEPEGSDCGPPHSYRSDSDTRGLTGGYCDIRDAPGKLLHPLSGLSACRRRAGDAAALRGSFARDLADILKGGNDISKVTDSL